MLHGNQKECIFIIPNLIIMKTITLQNLIALLRDVKGAKPATIVAVTDVKMNKKGNPYVDRATKMVVSNVFINFIYANSVNKALIKQGDEATFVPKARKWGQHIAGTPLIEHNGNFYLECRFLNATHPVYMVDGQIVDKSILEPFIAEKSSNADHQGLDKENEIIVRDFKLINIREIKINKEHYQIV